MGRTLAALVTALLLTLGQSAAWARLPAPTSDEVSKKQAAAQKKAQQEAAAKQALERAQDRVAARYKAKRRR